MVSLSGLNQHRLAQRRAGQGAVDEGRARTEQEGGEMRGEAVLGSGSAYVADERVLPNLEGSVDNPSVLVKTRTITCP